MEFSKNNYIRFEPHESELLGVDAVAIHPDKIPEAFDIADTKKRQAEQKLLNLQDNSGYYPPEIRGEIEPITDEMRGLTHIAEQLRDMDTLYGMIKHWD